jgi:hypothetical protein
MNIEKYNLSFDRCLELAEVRRMFLKHEASVINGGALHIVTEDGNIEDSNIQFCITQIESGEWQREMRKYHCDYSDEDMAQQLKLAKALLGLTELERECVLDGSTLSEEGFLLLSFAVDHVNDVKFLLERIK